ncbi:MAG: hypothetical protein IPK60_11760 [Sandaracinaceae bacterium]|nr:hypothetical protein [Sandaracinaceae bacterium]
MNHLSLVLIGCLLLPLSACSDAARSDACVPGSATACVCAGGGVGTAVCAADRTVGACTCNGAAIDSGLAVDLGASTDSSVSTDTSVPGSDLGVLPTDLGVVDSSVDAGCTSPTQCNDRNACTTDSCVHGACVFAPMSLSACDDSNPCTTDSCSTASGCVHAANTASCNDGHYCTISDHCSGGSCTGTAMNCGTGCVCSESSLACVEDTSGFRPALPPTCLVPAES